MERRTLGEGLEVSAIGLGCMGMSRVLRRARRGGVARDDRPRARARRRTSSTRPTCTGRSRTRSSSGGRSRTVASEVVLATKFGNVRGRERRVRRPSRATPTTCARLATRRSHGSASTTSTSTTSTASTEATPIEETVGAMAELVEAGQGAPPRALRGCADDDPARARRAPDHGAPERVLALDARSRGRDPADRPRARDRLRRLQPARAGLPHRADPVASTTSTPDDFRRRQPALPGRELRQEPRPGRAGARDRRGEGRDARAARARLGACARATTSSRSRGRSVCATWRRTQARSGWN